MLVTHHALQRNYTKDWRSLQTFSPFRPWAVGRLGLANLLSLLCGRQLFSRVRYGADRLCKLVRYHSLVC
jgi:hypothetical protein